jgi:hypothetical protein
MSNRSNQKRVLALDVHSRSMGFVAFEGPNVTLDWEIRCFRRGAVKISLGEKVHDLVDVYAPSVIVIGELAARQNKGWTLTLTAIQRQALRDGVPIRFVSREDVNRAFVGFEASKYEVASALAAQFPSLASRLPPKRKCWKSEDYRMGIFYAAAAGSRTMRGAGGRSRESGETREVRTRPR